MLAFNLVLLAMLPLSAFTMFLFVRSGTASDAGAFISGLVFGFSSFRLLHFHDHIHMTALALLPLAVLAFERWLGRPDWARAAVVAVILLMQALTSWYGTYYMLWTLLVFAAVGLARHGRQRLFDLPPLAATVGMAALLSLPFALPYRGRAFAGTSEATELYSARLLDYFLPHRETYVGQLLPLPTAPSLAGENALYVGAATLALAIVGLARSRANRLVLPAALTAATGFVLSLGPSLILGDGNRISPRLARRGSALPSLLSRPHPICPARPFRDVHTCRHRRYPASGRAPSKNG